MAPMNAYYDIDPEQRRRARAPHELFLINLITNHVLIFVATLGMASHNLEPLLLVPIISVTILSYTLWRARRARRVDDWYVMCHWQVAARRSRLFIVMLTLLATISGLAYVAHAYGGMMREAAYALAGGLGMLPTLVTVLVLIVLESDALHQARTGRMPEWVQRRFPQLGVAC